MLHGVRRLIPLVLILASACSGGSSDAGDESDESDEVSSAFSMDDALQPDGPLRGVAFSGHVDREEPKVHPTFSFTTQDTEVTAVIGLGDVDEGSTVVVTWYRVVGFEEREMLFMHEIAVGPAGRAFSQAVAPTGLAPGLYDTEATMDGHVTHTPFVVREAWGSKTGATAQAATGGEDWNVPDTGDSWSSDWTEFPPPPGIPNDTCTLDSINGGMTPMTDVHASAWWLGPCTIGTLTATVTGPPTTIASSDSLQGPIAALFGQSDVCSLSGGSDMPGTVVHFDATGSASGSEDYTLPDLGESLYADLEGIPAGGSQVEPGDKIKIHALAMVMPPALGVKTLYVDDGSDLLESVGNLSGRDEPVACDPRRVIARLFTDYSVPADASPVIELCATGVGFDGTESKNCISYYTVDVWTGTMELNLFKDYLAEQSGLPAQTCSGSWQTSLTFTIGDDDSISGQAHATLTSGPDCTFDIPGTATTIEFAVSGQAFADRFEFRFTQLAIDPPGDFMGMQAAMETMFVATRTTGAHAEASVSISTTEAGTFPVTGQGTLSLDCPACASEPAA